VSNKTDTPYNAHPHNNNIDAVFGEPQAPAPAA
jgi:hypothetical protein